MRKLFLFLSVLFVAAPVFSKNPAASLKGVDAKRLYDALMVEAKPRRAGNDIVSLKEIAGLRCGEIKHKMARPPVIEYFCDLDEDIDTDGIGDIYEALDVEAEQLFAIGATTYMKWFGSIGFRKIVTTRTGKATYAVLVTEEEDGEDSNEDEEGNEVVQVSGPSAESIYAALLVKSERVGPGLYLKKVGPLECGRSSYFHDVPNSGPILYQCELTGLLEPSGKAVGVDGPAAQEIYSALDVKAEPEYLDPRDDTRTRMPFLYRKQAGTLECSLNNRPIVATYSCRLSREK